MVKSNNFKMESDKSKSGEFNDTNSVHQGRPKRARKNLVFLEEIPNENWSTEEKKLFLQTLRMHGHCSLEMLQREIPTKSLAQLERYFMHFKRKSAKRDHYATLTLNVGGKIGTGKRERIKKQKRHTPAIDEWINHIAKLQQIKEDGCYIAKAFHYYAEFGEHPNPNVVRGLDFKSLYNNLSRLLKGLPMTPMNSVSAFFFQQSTKTLVELYLKVGSHYEAVLKDAKKNIMELNVSSQTKDSEYSSSCDKYEIFNSACLNPLLFSEKALQRKHFPDILIKNVVVNINSGDCNKEKMDRTTSKNTNE